MKYLSLAILILLVSGSFGFLYRQKLMSFFSKANEPEIVEIRDFQCEGMEGFTFMGWEVMRTVNNIQYGCTVYLNDNQLTMAPELAPQIKIEKHERPGKPVPGSPIVDYPPKLTLSNPQNIQYQGDRINSYPGEPVTEAFNYAQFYPDDAVKIELLNITNLFPRNSFWKQVIESFRITN